MESGNMRYLAPKTVTEAAQLLADSDGIARVLAGGTDLLVQMKAETIAPDLLVDIKHIPGMREITAEAGGWRIGAAVPGAHISEHAGLKADWPGVVEAAALIGSTQVQGRASIVGNLCNASPAADSVPALVAADARVQITGPKGTRDCAVIEIPVGPGKTTLQRGEIVTAVLLPARTGIGADACLRFIPRTEMDIAVCSAAVNVTLDESGRCSAARVALGAVAPVVLLVEEAADILVGSRLDRATLERLQSVCSKAARPIDDKRGTAEFRREVVGVMARRAARLAAERATAKAGEKA